MARWRAASCSAPTTTSSIPPIDQGVPSHDTETRIAWNV
jgi:hypothetical protein